MNKISLSRAWDETKGVMAVDGRLLVSVALALFVLPGLILDVTMPEAPADQLPPAGPWIAVAAFAVLMSFVGQLSVMRLATGPHLSVGEAISHGFKRLPSYVGAFLLWAIPLVIVLGLFVGLLKKDPEHPSLGVAIGLLVVSFAAFFLTVRLMLTGAVASLESANPLHILRRSWSLTAGNWWRLFAFVLLVGIAAMVLLGAVAFIMGALVKIVFDDVGPMTVGGLLIAIASQFLSAIFSVMFFTMLARIYAQLAGGADSRATVPKSGT
jgi:hypothetical protein